MSLKYTIQIPNPETHLAQVTLTFEAPQDNPRVFIAGWTPGSYLLREYARFVQGLTGKTEAGLAGTQKEAKGTWRVQAKAGEQVTLSYALYCHDLTVRNNHVDTTHAFFNGSTTFMTVEGMLSERCEVTIEHPEKWRIFTGLERDGERFIAAHFDELADTPIEIGPHESHTFEVEGKTHHLVFWGPHRCPVSRLIADIRSIVGYQSRFFGGLPYEHYTFIVHNTESTRGGLEHHNSTVLAFPRHLYATEKGYEDFLSLVSHEYFHTWNVKRIRPKALGPFDYRNENYTRALWVMEGWTCYYENLALVRARCMTKNRFVELLGERVSALLEVPGRHAQSLEESSYDAWIKLYRPHESNINTTVSYYLKGEVVAALLDLEIRAQTHDDKSLDDVLLALWALYQANPSVGFDEDTLQAFAEEHTGAKLQTFFDRYVRGVDEVPLVDAVARMGIKTALDHVENAYLGVRLRYEGDRPILSKVLVGSPAERAGLAPGDELVAIDNVRVCKSNLHQLLETYKPKDNVTIHRFKLGLLGESHLTFGAPPATKWLFSLPEDLEPEVKARMKKWLCGSR